MTMMQCGHAANAKTEDGKPICVICYGIDARAHHVAPEPDLTGRVAECAYNRTASRVPSNSSLPFFSHRPDKETDTYYSGCLGWD